MCAGTTRYLYMIKKEVLKRANHTDIKVIHAKVMYVI